MRIRLRVEHLLGLDRERHIALSKLAAAIGVSRHQLMHLLDNDAPHISRRTLGAVCEYLLGHGLVSPSDMFEQLFAIEPDAFWPMLATRQRIDMNLGVRWRKQMGWDQLIVAADAVLQSVLVNRLTGVSAESRTARSRIRRHAQQVINSELALSWGYHGSSDAEIQSGANSRFRQFLRQHNDKAVVSLGSIKSNPLTDPLIARGFKRAKAFGSQDAVSDPGERSVPFLMVYREDDPHPPSCWGGVRLHAADRKRKPGMYYESEAGQWELAPWSLLEDVALVYYRFLKGPQNLEMVLGGFSGRSTRCLAEMLRTGAAADFWPPVVDTNRVSMGAFIIKFTFRRRRKNEGITVRSHDRRIKTEVITISKESLESRMATPRS